MTNMLFYNKTFKARFYLCLKVELKLKYWIVKDNLKLLGKDE